MHAVTVNDTAGGTLIAAGGNFDFIDILNYDDEDYIWVKYDGSPTALTKNKGMGIPPGGRLSLKNDGVKNVYRHPVYGITDTGVSVEVRVQGASEP